MMGRPAVLLSEAQRAEVETLAAVLNAEQIADFLGIGRTTFFALLNRDPELCERYRRGKARAVGAVAQSLVTSARAGNVTAMIFFLKTQGGWRETLQVAPAAPEQPDQLDLTQLSDEELAGLHEHARRLLEAQAATLEARRGKSDERWSVA